MATSNTHFDVIVVGSGHAGTEAALAAARMGCNTAIVTLKPERSGWMPCNPAIGGVGKGHLVREIDALGGEMALAADETGIQFRRLNTRKGPAVQARRAQSDMFAYAERISRVVMNTNNLTVISGLVSGLQSEGKRIAGVTLEDGSLIKGKTVIITTGTFLRGLLHVGMEAEEGGQYGQKPANSLSTDLERLGLTLLRLKTGTPARLDMNSINWEILEEQPGDHPPLPFSFLNKSLPEDLVQVPCHITYTNEQTHEIIESDLARSPIYTGKIDGIGPRYCPSVEDKVVRFPNRKRHQVFLEPCARNSNMIYPNGISTSLPAETQVKFYRSIPGLEQCEFIRYGYAVEYDAVDPRHLYHWLELKDVPGLFLAGQINGTSGYEEAAGQGLIAGINAALQVQGKEPFVLDRSQAYIGVMIDDLTTRGVTEPYRMFTSRAEYRLLLREDNADARLTEFGRSVGLVDDYRWSVFQERMNSYNELQDELSQFVVSSNDAETAETLGLQGPPKQTSKLLDILNRTDLNWEAVPELNPSWSRFEKDVLELLVIEKRYEGYLERQRSEAKLFQEGEAITIPEQFDFHEVPGLRTEIKEILSKAKPTSLGQAARIPGVTPASLQLLTMMIRAHKKSVRLGDTPATATL